jgi:hypothetical protein
MIKLGKIVTDKVSGLKGMLTHYIIDMSHNVNYIFQPRGLNPSDGQPLKSTWLDTKRIEGGVEEEVILPLELLGTEAKDTASGYKGTIISLTYHENGCIHAGLKAKGKTSDGSSIDAVEFDIRRLEGPALKKMTEDALKESVKEKPSPIKRPERRY